MASLSFNIFKWGMHILAKTKLSGSKQDIPVIFLSCGTEALSYEVMNSQNIFFSRKGLLWKLTVSLFPAHSMVHSHIRSDQSLYQYSSKLKYFWAF